MVERLLLIARNAIPIFQHLIFTFNFIIILCYNLVDLYFLAGGIHMSIYYSGLSNGMVTTLSVGTVTEESKAGRITKNIFGKNVQTNFFLIWGIVAESLDAWDSTLNVLGKRLDMGQPFDFYVLLNIVPDHIVVAFASQKAKRGICNVTFEETVLPNQQVDSLVKERAKVLLGVQSLRWVSIPVGIVEGLSLILDEKSKGDLSIENIDDFKRLGAAAWGYVVYLNQSQKESILRFKKEEVENVEFNPIFKARNLTVDNKLAFGILQFDSKRSAFFDDLIKPVIEKEFQINVVKSGDMFDANNSNIMENIWTSINTSKFIICDLSGKNPNVFYELGIANTIGKPVITICDEDSFKKDYDGKLPFDVSTTNTIFYSDTAVGAKKFESKLKATVKSIITGQPISGNFY